MTASVATIVFALGILGLFALDRDRSARTSPALWLPVIWLAIGGSRMVSDWLHEGAPDLTSPGRLATIEQTMDGSPLDRNILMGLIAVGVMVLLWRKQRVG